MQFFLYRKNLAGRFAHANTICGQGDLEAASAMIQRSRGTMQDALQLQDLPEIQQDTDDLNHMRLEQFAPCYQIMWKVHVQVFTFHRCESIDHSRAQQRHI